MDAVSGDVPMAIEVAVAAALVNLPWSGERPLHAELRLSPDALEAVSTYRPGLLAIDKVRGVPLRPVEAPPASGHDFEIRCVLPADEHTPMRWTAEVGPVEALLDS